MPSVDFLHVCDYAFLDSHHCPCVIGIFDTLKAQSFPYRRAHLALAFSIRAVKGERCALTASLSNSKDELFRESPPIVFNGSKREVTFVSLTGAQIVFPEPGDYVAQILDKGKPIASRVLHVILDPNSSAPSEPTQAEDSPD